MDDYISRQAAINALGERPKIFVGGDYELGSVNQYDIDRLAIETVPSIDAVKVVRCRDCKHRYIDGENVRYNVCDLNHNKVQGDDWYCADAERRTDDKTSKGSSC